MSKHTKGNGTNDTSAVFVVTTDNIGKGIKWDESTGKYEANIGDGLEINSDGKIVVKPVVVNPRSTSITDNGTGKVIGEKYAIDYGNGLIEVNGIITMPLRTQVNGGTKAQDRVINGFVTGCSDVSIDYCGETMYHKETYRPISATELGMSKILSVNLLACDLAGYRTETPWLVNDSLFSTGVNIGVHTLATLKQDSIRVMFQIKGVKA